MPIQSVIKRAHQTLAQLLEALKEWHETAVMVDPKQADWIKENARLITIMDRRMGAET